MKKLSNFIRHGREVVSYTFLFYLLVIGLGVVMIFLDKGARTLCAAYNIKVITESKILGRGLLQAIFMSIGLWLFFFKLKKENE